MPLHQFYLKDKAKVLVNAQEGTTKSLRQWRFNTINDVNEELLLQYIDEAIEVEKAGLEVKPERKQTVIPQLLQQELEKLPELSQEFNKLTPFKQREYCEYIETAKRDVTKHNRLEKIKPMIMAGVGLNDKYR